MSPPSRGSWIPPLTLALTQARTLLHPDQVPFLDRLEALLSAT